jgi:V8-like Glu-specific endopeptidase
MQEISELKSSYILQMPAEESQEIREKMNQLRREETKYDFALLELERAVARDQYSKLPQNIEAFPQPQLVVSGYVQDNGTCEYRHWTSFQSLAEIHYGAIFYDIDTKEAQSGSPAYLQ